MHYFFNVLPRDELLGIYLYFSGFNSEKSQQQLQSGKFTTAKKVYRKKISSFVLNEHVKGDENLLKSRLGERRVAGNMHKIILWTTATLIIETFKIY